MATRVCEKCGTKTFANERRCPPCAAAGGPRTPIRERLLIKLRLS